MFLQVLISTTVLAEFNDFFLDKSLRIDYYHAGNHETEDLLS